MKSKSIIFIIIIVFIISMNLTYANEQETLKPFEDMMSYQAGLYTLYQNNLIDTYNYTIKINDKDKIVLNTVVADKVQMHIMYTVESENDDHIFVACENYNHSNSTDSKYWETLSKDGKKTYAFMKLIGELPYYGDSISLTFYNVNGFEKKIEIPFVEQDIIETDSDVELSIPLDNKNVVTRIHSSPLSTSLFIESDYITEVNNWGIRFSRPSINLYDCKLSTSKKELDYVNSGYANMRNEDNKFLGWGTYNSLDRNTKQIYLNFNNKKYTIDLKPKKTPLETYYPKDANELAKCIGPNRIIYLENKDYVLSDITFNTDYLTSKDDTGLRTISVNGVNNITIIGKEHTRLVSGSKYRSMINFNNCKNVKLDNLTMEKDQSVMKKEELQEIEKVFEEYGAIGIGDYILVFDDTKGVSVENCRLIGWEAYASCILAINNGQNISFKNSYFSSSKDSYMHINNDFMNLVFEKCTFYNKNNTYDSLTSMENNDVVFFNDCEFR